jgi:uncharacterized protein (DUF983 family)
MTAAKRSGLGDRLAAIVRARCPRCLHGRVFASLFAMHPRCPECGLAFEREQGYFVGAMYISYAAAVGILGAIAAVISLLAPHWSFERTMAVAVVLFLPLVPAVFRYSRILWIHIDRTIDPGGR